MKELSKILGVLINVANYGVGLAVAVILIFKKDFVSVFYVNGMSSNESLFFNMILFQAGLALLGLLLIFMTSDVKKKDFTVEFPVFYEIIPVIISGISIFYAFSGETAREKMIVIGSAVLYSALSVIIIYSGARIFQLYNK